MALLILWKIILPNLKLSKIIILFSNWMFCEKMNIKDAKLDPTEFCSRSAGGHHQQIL